MVNNYKHCQYIFFDPIKFCITNDSRVKAEKIKNFPTKCKKIKMFF